MKHLCQKLTMPLLLVFMALALLHGAAVDIQSQQAVVPWLAVCGIALWAVLVIGNARVVRRYKAVKPPKRARRGYR